MPGTAMLRARELEWKWQFGAHQHQRLPASPGAAASDSARNTMRRYADTAADQERAWPRRHARRSPCRSGRGRKACRRAGASRAPQARARRSCRASRSSPRWPSARMIDSGRRIGTAGPQVRWTKLPGVAAAAHFGARRRSTNWPPSNASVTDDVGVLEEDRAAVAAWRQLLTARACGGLRRRARARPCASRRRSRPGGGSPTAARRRHRR